MIIRESRIKAYAGDILSFLEGKQDFFNLDDELKFIGFQNYRVLKIKNGRPYRSNLLYTLFPQKINAFRVEGQKSEDKGNYKFSIIGAFELSNYECHGLYGPFGNLVWTKVIRSASIEDVCEELRNIRDGERKPKRQFSVVAAA